MKTLPGHTGPVAAVDINQLNGNIVSCAGSCLYVWDVNGVPVASIDTAPPPTTPTSSSLAEAKQVS